MKKQKRAEIVSALLSAKDAKARAADLVGGTAALTEVPNHGRASRLKVGARVEVKGTLVCRGRTYARVAVGDDSYTLSPAILKKVSK